MWGLLPACVLPYLVRRVGYQPAYAMTLTTDRIDADAALRCHLVDTVSSDLDDALRKLLLRLMRLDPRTVLDLKTYFRHMWFLDEPMREAAVAESARLALEPRVAQNISRFVADGAYPWDPPTPHGVR
jgi:polyketide biosynthesis enoyl-CoA hydratase PksH